MNNLSGLYNDFLIWLSGINQPATWTQVGIIAGALLIAALVSRYLRGVLYERAHADIRGIRKLTLRSAQRILFPISAMLVIWVARFYLQAETQPVQILTIALTLLLSLAGIRLFVYMLRKGFAQGPMLKAWENILATFIWIVVALYLLDWLPVVTQNLDALAIQVGKARVSLLSVINFVLLIAFLFTLAMWLSAYFERRMTSASTISPTLRVGLLKFFKFFLITISVLIAMDAVGIDLTALTVFGGALGVGLGFGLQRIASNFISGFLLLFDRSIKPGDVISIGNKFGWVQELRARYIVVRDRDGVETLIPNENLITTDVINWSYSDKNVRLRIPVSISYGDDPEKALQIILQAATASRRVLTDPEPVARLMEFGDNGIHLELRVWISDPENGLSNVRSDVNLAIWRMFKDNGITIPFPQRDVYIKTMPSQ